ncbi:uncharacterized protein MONOS_13727 [Monocercomonoides exilis]|uniref:uncharacterized protein n=1 Tax=Monocercomonoides exilis TaxID=2049356 RepID=UPI00355AC165|nr:hypothetical protein MONOS_13727 [Monocercomonoides exilis]|eukprot:MONOS_13727.1-p1 / transcript=MONOS_13727.1 / gene=MONOS_13727 / organism=Monocercomonoides_exilis_PA203 / gene_product=unspecified product / transcript_product=unspecified product / location=Mono_scaffold00872:1622-9469(+) / protein_length=2615 / sequence_SO=supercontig / SO=protein_coding / is_pseudo=false
MFLDIWKDNGLFSEIWDQKPIIIIGTMFLSVYLVCLLSAICGKERNDKVRKEYDAFHVRGMEKSGILERRSVVRMFCEIHNSSVELKEMLLEKPDDRVIFEIRAGSLLQVEGSVFVRKNELNGNYVRNGGACWLINATLGIGNGHKCGMMGSLVKMEGSDLSSLFVKNSEFEDIVFCESGCSILRDGSGSFEGIQNCIFANISKKYDETEEIQTGKERMMKRSSMEDCDVKRSMNVLEGGIVSGTEGSVAFLCNNCTFVQNERIDRKVRNTDRNTTTQTQTFTNAEWIGCNASSGGALYVHDNSSATLTVENSSFVKCNATSTRGGGIFALKIAECTVKHSTFVECYCVSSNDNGGAGAEIEGMIIQVFVENCLFKDGWSGNDAGGLGIWSSKTNKTKDCVLNCFFKNCSGHNSGNGDGGGYISWTATDKIVAHNCLFQGCHTVWRGGAVSIRTDGYGGNLLLFCFFHNNTAIYGNDIYIEDNSTHSQVIWCFSTSINGNRYYAGGDKSYWLPNEGGRSRFVASRENQTNSKDTFSCGLNESCACLTISHCLSQMIEGFVEEIKVLSGTVAEGKGIDVGEKTISVNGVSSSGSAIETQFEASGLSLFCVGAGELTVSDLSVVHNTLFENNRQCILFEVEGSGLMDVKRMSISMDSAHSEERSIQNSLVILEGGELKMQDVKWEQTFSITSMISLSQESSVTLSLDNCVFSNIVRTTAGSSLISVSEGSYSITLDGCTIDGCGNEDCEFGGGIMAEMGNIGSLNVKGGIVKNCYASATQGRGGGIGLKVRDTSAEFLISSGFEGNKAKWGSDIFVDSIDLESTATSGKIASLTASLETKSKMQGYENGDESFPIPLCVYLWNNFSTPAFVGGGSLSHDFSKCGFEEFSCSSILKAVSLHFEGKKKDVALLEPFSFEEELELISNEWSIASKENEMKCDVSDQKEGAQRGLIENSMPVSVTGIVFSLKKSLTFHESVFECHSGKLALNGCGMEGGTEPISTVFVKAVGGVVEVSEFGSENMKIGDSSIFVVEGNAESVPSMNMTHCDFSEITFGDGCAVECHEGIIEEMSGCTFSSITRSKGSGGCISIVNNDDDNDDGRDYKVEINDCTFEGCAITGEEGTEIGGGAFFCEASSKTNLLINMCKFYCCRAPYEEGSVGYGGGIMLKILKEEAIYVISSLVFSSEKPNNAKYGKDLFISSPSLAKSIKNETLPFVKDRLEMLTEDSMRGYDGENKECAIPLIYFWKSIGSSVYIAEEGNNVVVCGLLEYPCRSVDYGVKRGSDLGIELIAVQGICDVRNVIGMNGMKLEGTNGESDKIRFAQTIEGNGDAVVECKGVVQFGELGILIPSSFDNGANILIQTGSEAIKTSVVSCSINRSNNVEDKVSFVLISALKGIVSIEKTEIAGFSTMHEIMSISADCVTTMNNVTFEDISLSGKSAIAMSESVIPGSGNDNAEEMRNILFEQCTFVNVKHNGSSNPSLLCCDISNEVRLKMENSTIDGCGSTSSNEGGGMFFLLNERGKLEVNHTNVTDCFCSNIGRGGGLFLKSQSVSQKALPFVLSNITFKENVASKGRDVFVKCTDLDSQISESQFLINFGEPFVRELAIWGCTADNYGDEEDLLRRVFVFRSEFIFVSSIVGNSSDSKQCGEMKSTCWSLNVGVSHIIPSDYSQLLIWNETELTGSCSAEKVTIKSMEASRNGEIKVKEIELGSEGVVRTSESVRFEKVSFVFGGMGNIVCSCLIHQLNGSLILESVSFLSESRTAENSQIIFDFSLIVVEDGLFEAEKCSVGHLKFSKSVFEILHSERATFEDVGVDDVECKGSLIECGKSEKVSISKFAATNIELEEKSLISLGNSHSSLVLSLILSSFTNISRSTSGSSIVCTSQPMSGFEMCNCLFHECTSESSKGSQVAIALGEKILIESCVFEGNLVSGSEGNEISDEVCKWNGSVVDLSKSEAVVRDTTICNSSKGGMSVSGGSVLIEAGNFSNNSPSIENYQSVRRNIICSNSASLTISSLKGGDGVKENSSLWILNEGCNLEGIVSERASPFFIPVLESVEAKEVGEEVEIVFKGEELLPCDLSFMVVKQIGEEKQIEQHEFGESGYVSETEVEGRLPKEMITEAGEGVEVSVCILFGDGNNPSSTDSFILKNKSESKTYGEGKLAEGGKEGKSYWLLIVIVIIMTFVLLIILIVAVILAVRWRKQKRRTKELEVIVEDTVKKDPKLIEMVTMEMSPEEQWRRAEREAEKKNEERIKKRVYEKSLGHSESSEHLLSESGSTEYILGKDSDKIPEWALEKVEEEEIRKRSPSPSISSTSTTDSDSTFVRGEDLCPTTSSMSNLVDAMACSSPHEKLIVDLRDSLFMLLHGRNAKKEMAIGSLKEREQTAAQVLFWVANGALHSFDEMENPLQSLANLSPHIVLFSEHMVICIVMHSDLLSDDDSDSSSISSSAVVTSASYDDDDESDSLPSSAFEEDEDAFRKECLRWKAPELQMNKKMGATKESVVFSIGMMVWECVTLEIPFEEYEGVVAGQKIVNGERPDFLKTEGSNLGGLIIACTRTESVDRISLGDVKRELIGNFPPGAAMLTVTDALGLIQESEDNERESKEIGTEDESENMKFE